jgi:transcriptional regulator with GAF, ATPase, and Fis domain
VQEIIPRAPFASPSLEGIALACPDCGSKVHLALIPTSPTEAAEAHSRGAASALRSAPDPGHVLSFEDSIQRHKRELITRALEKTDGVMTRAAKALGLKYTTFVAMAHRLEVRAANGKEIEAE